VTPLRPLADLRFCLAGSGRVGSSMARWAAASGARPVAVAYHAAPTAAAALAADLGARAVPLAELESGDDSDLLLVAVPDPALPEVVARLAGRRQAPVALHTSGSRGADVLAPLAAGGGSSIGSSIGSAIGALHPLKAFPRPLPHPDAARGVFFAVDGDPDAVALAERLVAAWGGVAGRVPGDRRDLYHLAATLAAGGVTTLLATAERIARAAGLPPAVVGGYLELARGAVAAATEEVVAGGGVAAAITGPVARGDDETVARHLAALADLLPDLVPLVALLGRETLERQRESAPLTAAQSRLAERLARVLG
jgi:predicted short-subunit dehydrogenase-like oxidoreductase (DUF2520 family)